MKWLPVVCVLALVLAILVVLSQGAIAQAPAPYPAWTTPPAVGTAPPAATAQLPVGIPTTAVSAAPVAATTAGPVQEPAPSEAVPVASDPQPSDTTPAVADPRVPVVDAVAPPIWVAPGSNSTPAPTPPPAPATAPAIAAVPSSVWAPTQPPPWLAVAQPPAASAPAPAPTSRPVGWPDNAPATAREDAAARSWPYPPMNLGAPPPNDAQSPNLNPPLIGDNPERVAPPAQPSPANAMAEAARKEQNNPLTGWGEPPAPALDPRRFTEAHWQGLEVIPNTPLIAATLKIPLDAPGVIIDDVTLPADLQGFQGGDLVMQVAGVPTPDLMAFIEATDRVRDVPRADVVILRDSQLKAMTITGLRPRLGTANGETATMIRPGARMPHPYRGPCTNCHRIGTTGNIPVDQGSPMIIGAPAIRADAKRPHRDRGPCTACHQILP